MKAQTACLIVFAFLLVLAPSSYGYWDNTGIPVSVIGEVVTAPAAVGDGTGGVVIAWGHDGSGTQGAGVYVQRLDANGEPEWGAGQRISVFAPSAPEIVASDNGWIVAWIDQRTGTGRIFATYVAENGSPTSYHGVNVFAPGVAAGWTELAMVSLQDLEEAEDPEDTDPRYPDPRGDVIIVGVDDTGGIHAAHVGQLIEPLAPIAQITSKGRNPVVVPTELFGAIVVWERQDLMNAFARRIRRYGIDDDWALWTNEVPVFHKQPEEELRVEPGVQAVGVQGGGVMVVAYNQAGDLLGQRLRFDGDAMWPLANEVLHPGAKGVARQEQPSIAFSDNMVTIVFEHTPVAPGSRTEIYAQRIDIPTEPLVPGELHYNLLWGSMGKPVSLGDRIGNASAPKVIWANVDNVRCVWQETDPAGETLYAQFLDENGDSRWHDDGILQTTNAGISDIVTAGFDRCGLFAAWREQEPPVADGIYANRLEEPSPPLTPRYIGLEAGADINNNYPDCDIESPNDVCYRLVDNGKSYPGVRQQVGYDDFSLVPPPEIVSDVARMGSGALRFTAGFTDAVPVLEPGEVAKQRNRLTLAQDIPFDAERYVGFSLRVNSSGDTLYDGDGDWTSVMALRQDIHAPGRLGIALYDNDGLAARLQIESGVNSCREPIDSTAIDISQNQWVDLVVGFNGAPSGEEGWVKLWRNGRLLDDDADGYTYSGNFGEPNPSECVGPVYCVLQRLSLLTIGIYRGQRGGSDENRIQPDLTVYFDEIRYGMSYEDVALEPLKIRNVMISTFEDNSEWTARFTFDTDWESEAYITAGVHDEPSPSQCTSCNYTITTTASPPGLSHTIDVPGLSPETSYCFQISASGEYDFAPVDTVFAPDTNADMIYDLDVAFLAGRCQMEVSWYTRAPGEINTLLYRKDSNPSWNEAEATSECEVPRAFEMLLPVQGQTLYHFKVQAVRDGVLHEVETTKQAVRCQQPPDPGVLSARIPERVALSSHPNPFNPTTTISFDVPERTDVALAIYGANGALIQTLASGVRAPGTYQVTWDGTTSTGGQLSTGVYFARLVVGQEVLTRKLVLLK